MWKVPKPTWTSGQAFLKCISRVSDPALKARLHLIEGEIVQASDAFEAAAASVTLHTLPKATHVGGVTKDEMSDVYTHRMARKRRAGRAIYDEILAAPAYGRCPLCGQRTVSTLDHHLPKTNYPALAVTPANLVPSCTDCNKAKLDYIPTTSGDATLHPYFDDVQEDLWLRAEVVETLPAALRFFVDLPNHWNATLGSRVRQHFALLNLSYLYASQAAEELLNIRYYLSDLFHKAGPDAVKLHLAEKAASCAQARTNSWQTATYSALAASDWFCAEGFANA